MPLLLQRTPSCLVHRFAGISAPKISLIDEFVAELRALGFELDIEDDFNCFLGIGIEILPDGTCHMTQKGLIQKVIKATGLENCNPNGTPATQVALRSDPEGEPFD